MSNTAVDVNVEWYGSFLNKCHNKMTDIAPYRRCGNKVQPVKDYLELFLEAVFGKCPSGGIIIDRSLVKPPGSKRTRPTTGHGGKHVWTGDLEDLTSRVLETAQATAAYPGDAVHCPIPAIFREGAGENEQALACVPVLLADFDEDGPAGLRRAIDILGEPTVVVESGGVDDQGQPKLHAYWCLSEPATGEAALGKVKRARKLMASLFGGDDATGSLVQPMRCPGSVHKKDPSDPRLCTLVWLSDGEIELADALARLEKVAGTKGGAGGRAAQPKAAGSPDPVDSLEAAVAQRKWEELRLSTTIDRTRHVLYSLPPEWAVGYIKWLTAGAALHHTFRGRPEEDEALALWDEWSEAEGGDHYQEGECAAKWASFHREGYGVHAATFATLVHVANEHRRTTLAPAATADRPVIVCNAHDLNPATREVVQHLKPHLFWWGGRIVAFDPVGCQLKSMTSVAIGAMLEDHVRFVRGTTAIATPKGLRDRIAVGTCCEALAVIKGIASVPILHQDGSLSCTPGFDAESGLYLPPAVPMIDPNKLTAACDSPARLALAIHDKLIGPFSGYFRAHHLKAIRKQIARRQPVDFSGGDDPGLAAAARRYVALLAASLTGVLRASLDTAPGIMISAPLAGSGKTKLARAIAMILTGRDHPVGGAAKDPKELEKRITASIMAGGEVLLLDNLPIELASADLEAGLTASAISLRPLGSSETQTVECRALVLVTGNGGRLGGDLARRFMKIDLDQGAEPERATYDFDPVQAAKALRLQILEAAHALVRIARAEKVPCPLLGSFERWSETVGAAVLWLTGVDPGDAVRETQRMAAAERIATDPVAELLVEAIGHDRGFTIKEAAKIVGTGKLAEAIGCEDHKVVFRLGRWCEQNRDRVFAGRKLIKADGKRHNNVNAWRLIPV